MITPVLILLFEKDLNKLIDELKLYTDEGVIWKTEGAIQNSGGNLCLHITGNLQHYIGAVLGDSGYVRNRNAEFTLKNIPRLKLLEGIQDTKTVVRDTLEQISKKELEKVYPQQVLDEPVTTEYFLLHLINHMNYHLGQINYHRRLVS
ncbi:MAG: DinB family protein [Chitinophagaceae bacterium]